ncbi:MAG: hypothetical protein IJK53_07390 [Erysipelotrichaceae bacterium]|nr:hypothetical protein [Clostridia bacterium]MBQ6217193.1 hypothetical protein [Erysipelotrichaceae bacterium]
MKKQIVKDRKYPIITVFDDIVVDGLEEFEFCQENDIPYRINRINLLSKNHLYSWICSKQLTRSDINSTMYRFLIGFQTLAEMTIEGAYYKGNEFNNGTAIENMAKLYSMNRQRISSYKNYAINLIKIHDENPDLAGYILSEQLLSSYNNIEYLAKRKSFELEEILLEFKKQENGETIRFNDLVKNIDSSYKPARTKKIKIDSSKGLEIKKMPEYDPDAELNSLSFTISSWINTMNRVDERGMDGTSREAKKELSNELKELIYQAYILKKHLGVR